MSGRSVLVVGGSSGIGLATALRLAAGDERIMLAARDAGALDRAADTAVHGTLHLAQAVPNMGAYATSKWGQRALVRTLQQEVRDEPSIHVCLVSPGSINTPIYYQAANYTGRDARPPVPVLQPERAGAAIAGLLDRPRHNVSVPVGPSNPLVIAGFRLLPGLYDLLVGPLFRLAALTSRERAPGAGNVHKPAGDADRLHGHWPSP